MTEEKVRYIETPLQQTLRHVEPRTTILGVHACGSRTDICIEHAIALGGALAVLPCCRRHRSHRVPHCLTQSLGADLAIDVDRTYRLDAAGYRVRWDQIPPQITSENRVLIASPTG